jgi:DNA-binding NarL/FixJ family response regulator
MAVLGEHLVGRAEELRALDGALARLERRAPGALALVGEPGIGKTRLLSELAARADARRCIVLSGSASELEAELPFWVFVDALDEYVAGLEPRRLARLDDDTRHELGQILPSLTGRSREAPGTADARYRAHRAARELLERLADAAPIVLLLDDMHWADDASIELLGALLRRPPDAPVLLALGIRPRQLPSRLASALERAQRAGALSRLEPAALQRDEALALLGDGFDGRLAERLWSESGGNPFYLEQLARSVARTGHAAAPDEDSPLAGVEVPPAVAGALSEELALLSPQSRRVLEGAAVAGDPFEPELAATAAAVDETSVIDALDELLALDVVRRTDVPRRFRFRHPLVRRAVYEAAPGGWVLHAHERCARALADRGTPATGRAHHIEFAGRTGDADAIAVLREAGHGARPRAPVSAARWFGAALRLLPERASPNDRVELLTARATAHAATGRLADSRDDLLESLALLPADAASARAQVTAACAAAEHLLGRHEQAHGRLVAALQSLPESHAPDTVALMMQLAIDGIFRAEYASACDWGARALAVTRSAAPHLTTAVTALAALTASLAGATGEAERHRAQAAAAIDAMTDDELARPLDAAAHLATAELYLDHYEEAATHAGRALALARATRQQSPSLVPTLGTALVMRGRLADAAELFDGGVEAARLSGIAQAQAWSLAHRSLAATAAGDVDAALATAEEAVDLTRDLQERFISAWSALALAGPLLASGDPGRAVGLLLHSAGGEELPLIPAGWRILGLALLTRCRLELGRPGEARGSVARAESGALALGLPMASAWADRAAADVALDAGAHAAAAARALASVTAAKRSGAVVEAALSATLAGQALARAGDRDAAVAELERAAADLDACGARRHRDAAERELRKLGRPMHRRTRPGAPGAPGIASLTERELQVARLVVDRRSNREIAAELFLSLKTVETHMRNLFRKLDVSSRVEVARTVERADRARSPR